MIKVRHIGSGVSLVEILESDLKILCGCPMNVYKLLRREEAIVPMGHGDIMWESGPNAILLSELPVQGGRFSNLIEFPVLQMLYRQGMIVPGHPNNHGQVPLLVGLRRDLDAVARYVHLGNYGLSREELVAAGLSADKARDLLRMKLKFAFGHFRSTEELLEFRVIDGPAVELRNGAFLRRLGCNRYQFFRGDEGVEVDLNLGEGEVYECPYELSGRVFSRELFSVVHLGEGDGWDGERPCMSSLVIYRGQPWLIDAGPHVSESLAALGLGVNDLGGVFITHAHDDHIVGLTALLHAERRIAFLAVPWVRATVEAKLEALAGLDDEAFRETFEVVDMVEGEWNDVEGMEVRPFLSPHPLETTCLVFRAGDASGRRSYAHLADLSSFAVIDSLVTDDSSEPGISRDFAARAKAEYLAPADLKKVDAGGGMIHGDAADFRADASGLVFFSHTSSPLALGNPPVGRVAGFGEETLLLSDNVDYRKERALVFLARQFPDIPVDDFASLLEGGWRAREKGDFLVESGRSPEAVFLILSGMVDYLGPDGLMASVASGTLVGEAECLSGLLSVASFRCATRVELFCLDAGRFAEFIQRKDLAADRARRREVAAFLRSCPVFADLSSFGVLAGSAVLLSYSAGERLGGPGQALHIILSGSVGLFVGDRRVLGIGPRGVFGAESILSPGMGVFEAVAEEDLIAYLLPAEPLRSIPAVLWKLRELLHRRLAMASQGYDFAWRESYSVGVPIIDEQHKELFRLLSEFAGDVAMPEICPDALPRMAEIRAYALMHFGTEEGLMRAASYPEFPAHRARHEAILAQIDGWSGRLECGEEDSVAAFCDFLKDWILRHILSVDRAYAGKLGC